MRQYSSATIGHFLKFFSVKTRRDKAIARLSGEFGCPRFQGTPTWYLFPTIVHEFLTFSRAVLSSVMTCGVVVPTPESSVSQIHFNVRSRSQQLTLPAFLTNSLLNRDQTESDLGTDPAFFLEDQRRSTKRSQTGNRATIMAGVEKLQLLRWGQLFWNLDQSTRR